MTTRREILLGLPLMGVAVAASAQPTEAADRVPAATRGKCATCRFWGGVRQLSPDGRTVIASGTGICNNPRSPAYTQRTRPTQGAPNAWEKWDQIG